MDLSKILQRLFHRSPYETKTEDKKEENNQLYYTYSSQVW